MAECKAIDVIALHSYASSGSVSATALDTQLSAYSQTLRSAVAKGSTARLILQEWGAVSMDGNRTRQAEIFSAQVRLYGTCTPVFDWAVCFSPVSMSRWTSVLRLQAQVAARHEVPQIYWGLQPASLPTPASDFGICPPAPAPTHSGTQTVWQTALYPATQAAALQIISVGWPEVWGCSVDHRDGHSSGLSPDCEMNGRCVAVDSQSALPLSKRRSRYKAPRGYCLCEPGWRGPTCASLKLGATPRNSGFRHENHSSWGGSVVKDPPLPGTNGANLSATVASAVPCL